MSTVRYSLTLGLTAADRTRHASGGLRGRALACGVLLGVLGLLATTPAGAAPMTAGAPPAETAGLMVVGTPVDPLPAWGTGWSAEGMPAWPSSGDPAEARDVLRVPAGPDSSTLFLWALGGLGAWQLGRYTRKWHVGALPEWYHTGGPAQVGHAQRLDLERITLDVPLWYDVRAAVPAPAGPIWRFVDTPPRLRSLARPLAAAPRGPPWWS